MVPELEGADDKLYEDEFGREDKISFGCLRQGQCVESVGKTRIRRMTQVGDNDNDDCDMGNGEAG